MAQPSITPPSFAFHIPSLNLSKSWRCGSFCSIFTAELLAVKLALEHLYSSSIGVPLITLYIDSLSTIQSLVSQSSTSDIISDILTVVANFKSAGTLVSFFWVPSHCGISGNETADNLAKKALSDPTTPTFSLPASLNDQTCLALRIWKSELLSTIQNKSAHFDVALRSHLGPLPWHYCSSRQINIALHRLITFKKSEPLNLSYLPFQMQRS